MEEGKISATIYHDLEKNIYYRINKDNGQISRAHKNGSLLKTFKMNITGSDYKMRKSIDAASNKDASPARHKFQ